VVGLEYLIVVFELIKSASVARIPLVPPSIVSPDEKVPLVEETF